MVAILSGFLYSMRIFRITWIRYNKHMIIEKVWTNMPNATGKTTRFISGILKCCMVRVHIISTWNKLTTWDYTLISQYPLGTWVESNGATDFIAINIVMMWRILLLQKNRNDDVALSLSVGPREPFKWCWIILRSDFNVDYRTLKK